jgi:dephospho-CoA kinase
MTPAPRAAVIEVPLLFESGMDAGCDATLVVVSDEELTAGRTAARGHAAAGARGERQLSQEEKARRATYVVRNDGTEADLEAAVSGILDKLSP